METVTASIGNALQVSTTYPYNLIVGTLVAGATLYMVRKYFGGGVCYSKAKLTGKTVIVTGANTGVGLETAVDLAGRGARVILACRSKEKGEAAVDVVKKRAKTKNAVFAKLDLASLDSVREFAAKMLDEEPHIDILINNAGVSVQSFQKTVDGFEWAFGVNHLAHFLLTNLLLDRMKEAPAARIVNVTSSGHTFYKMNFDNLQAEQKYSPLFAYCQSKLANVLFTRSLAQRLRGTSVTCYSPHPGAVATEFTRHYPRIFDFVFRSLVLLVVKTPWEGAQTSIYCAVAEGIEKHSGKYFADCKVKKSSNPQATDDDVAERLWQISAQMVGLDN